MIDLLTDYRDPQILRQMKEKLWEYKGRPLAFMEVCGTHTMSMMRYGIKAALPPSIRMVSGPGCPVCVTESTYIDTAIELSERGDVLLATFGDLMRVPSCGTSLLARQSAGADIKAVYSPLDTLKLCVDHPDKKVVFLSVGFETTIPVIALTVIKAKEQGIGNLSLLTANKTMPRALEALMDDDLGINGFLFPGHVCSVTGTGYFEDFCIRYKIPGVITGFEPADILGGIQALISQVEHGTARAENAYRRVVRREGNPQALEAIDEVFKPSDAVWRGIGMIPGSGLSLREEFAYFDARRIFPLSEYAATEPEGCLCGEILKGKKMPADCPLFGSVCSPADPVGACMVSSEGTCAAHYKYNR